MSMETDDFVKQVQPNTESGHPGHGCGESAGYCIGYGASAGRGTEGGYGLGYGKETGVGSNTGTIDGTGYGCGDGSGW